jgi:hypothetical protein
MYLIYDNDQGNYLQSISTQSINLNGVLWKYYWVNALYIVQTAILPVTDMIFVSEAEGLVLIDDIVAHYKSSDDTIRRDFFELHEVESVTAYRLKEKR